MYLPPWADGDAGFGNLAIPDVWNDIDTIQQYPVGATYRTDERTFKYARVVNDIDIDGADRNIRRGMAVQSTSCVNSYTDKLVAETGYNTLGVKKLKIDMTTHVDFMNVSRAVVANDYAGGHFTLYTPSAYWGCKVLANTAEDASGYVYLTLESALPVALTSTHIIQFEEYMYWRVIYPGASANYSATVGFPLIWEQYKTIANGVGGVAAGNFIWLQTWGPYEGIVFGNAHGGAESERFQYLAGAGYPDKDYIPAVDVTPQLGGFHTACNYKGGAPADFDYNYLTTFFLMIAP